MQLCGLSRQFCGQGTEVSVIGGSYVETAVRSSCIGEPDNHFLANEYSLLDKMEKTSIRGGLLLSIESTVLRALCMVVKYTLPVFQMTQTKDSS